MATHISAEKRARQAIKRQTRNSMVASKVHTAQRKVLDLVATDPKKAEAALSEAFKVIQTSKGVIHRNAVRRKMARLSKAVAKAKKAS